MKHKNKAEQDQEEVLEFNPDIQEQTDEEEYPESVSVEHYNALYDQYVRVQADFENFKRRNAMTASTMYMNGINDMIEEILPVLDYLDPQGLQITPLPPNKTPPRCPLSPPW